MNENRDLINSSLNLNSSLDSSDIEKYSLSMDDNNEFTPIKKNFGVPP